MELKIEYIPTSEIQTYANNAKIHTAEQIEQIKKSIEDFGMNDPIAVWGDKNEIVEGHGRLIACTELRMDKVPVIRLDELTDAQRRAYMLVHNKLTMDTGFNMDVLQMELATLDDMDMSEFGFTLEISDNDEDWENGEESEIPETEPSLPREENGNEYGVVVICSDEADMVATYKRLTKQGFNCRPL